MGWSLSLSRSHNADLTNCAVRAQGEMLGSLGEGGAPTRAEALLASRVCVSILPSLCPCICTSVCTSEEHIVARL